MSSSKMEVDAADNTDEVQVVESVKTEDLDLKESPVIPSPDKKKEVASKDKSDETETAAKGDVSQEQIEIDLTTEEADKLSGGCKVFRETLNTFASCPDEDVTAYHVMDKCKSVTCYVGIDEAGRGPVLGPMVYSIFACVADENAINEKKKKGQSLSKIEDSPPVLLDTDKKFSKLNDSKQLTEKVREEIFKKFSDLEYISFGLKIISPSQIANKSYRRRKYSLNEISHNAAFELIQGLADRGVKIERVFVDTVGPMDKYQQKLEQKFPDLRFKVDKKADAKYKPVSAASVCAKVTRDIALKEWKFPTGENVDLGPAAGWGSGYPGDPVTKRFLRKNIDPVFGFPNIVRNSWSTASDLLEKGAVKIKWESDETNEAPAPKISKYFGKKSKEESGKDEVPDILKQKSQFFCYRELQQTTSIF